jgi:hypothetical protein
MAMEARGTEGVRRTEGRVDNHKGMLNEQGDRKSYTTRTCEEEHERDETGS